MLTLTIQETLESAERTQGHCIYVYRESTTIFYVGRSTRPCERLREHMGQGRFTASPDAIGLLILNNTPQSLLWAVEIWTLQELRPDVYQEALEDGMLSNLIGDLEAYLISRIKPCLNAMGRNYSNPLPERYATPGKIANAGVKLD